MYPPSSRRSPFVDESQALARPVPVPAPGAASFAQVADSQRSPFADEWEAVGESARYTEPEFEALEPEYEDLEPEYEEAEPELDEAEPELEEIEPELEGAEPELNEAEPELEARLRADDEQVLLGEDLAREDNLVKPAKAGATPSRSRQAAPSPSAPPPPIEKQACEDLALEHKMRKLIDQRLWPTTDVIKARRCPSPQTETVAVVGGGLAGLTAAWYLTQFGVTVTLFEASDRVGGRVSSDYTFVKDKVVERGAELIGRNHPMWWLLAKRYGLNLVELSTTEDYAQRQRPLDVRVRLGGAVHRQPKKLWDEIERIYSEIARDAAHIDEFEPWKPTPNAPKTPNDWDRMTIAERLGQLNLSPDALRFMKFLENNDNFGKAENQSYLGLLSKAKAHLMGADVLGYWHCRETHKCADGSEQLARRLADELTAKVVKKNAPVKAITVGTKVRIQYRDPVTGKLVSKDFSYAVLAAPPTVWDKMTIGPDFPVANYTITHGGGVKLLAPFEKPFWENLTPSAGAPFKGLAASAWWDEMGQVWESTDKQSAWEKIGKQPPRRKRGYVLCTYSGGTIPDGKNVGSYTKQMDEFYPGYAKLMTKNPILVNWSEMEWIKTGASSPARGEVTRQGKNLVEAPFMGRLHFAGEHTCVPFHGYMEGALQSGARAGRDIVDLLCGELRVARTDQAPAPAQRVRSAV